jgi:hypothetical protein
LPVLAGPFFAPDELPENQPEDQVPRGCLREGASIRQERWQALLTARRMVAVDEVAERVEREMFGKRHPERQASWLDCNPAADAVEDDAEDRAVQRV